MIYQLPIEIVGKICLNLVSLVIQWRYTLCMEGLHSLWMCRKCLTLPHHKMAIASWNISRVKTMLIDLRKITQPETLCIGRSVPYNSSSGISSSTCITNPVVGHNIFCVCCLYLV